MTFEVSLNNGFIITNSGAAILDETAAPPVPGNPPSPNPLHPLVTNRIASTKQNLHAHVRWSAAGLLHQAFNGIADWTVSVYFESLGQTDVNPGTFTGTKGVAGGFVGNYDVQVNIPAGALPVGVYKVAYAVTLNLSASNTPLPVAGFEDGGLIQIFEGL